MIVVELLLGEIPERAQFKQPDMKRSLAPYFILTQGEFWIQPRDLKVAEIAQNVPFGSQLKIASKLGWSDISWNVLFSSSLLFDCIYYAFFGCCAINRSFAGMLLTTLARQSSVGVPLRLCRGSWDYKHCENSTYLQCFIFQFGGWLGALFGGLSSPKPPVVTERNCVCFKRCRCFALGGEGGVASKCLLLLGFLSSYLRYPLRQVAWQRLVG